MDFMSSGKQLLVLLSERRDEIINRENGNNDRIFVYDTGRRWTAFEKSAYQLARLYSGCEVMPLILNGYPFPIVIASVPHHAISDIRSGNDGVCSIPAQRAISLRTYQTWHSRLGKRLSGYRAINDK